MPPELAVPPAKGSRALRALEPRLATLGLVRVEATITCLAIAWPAMGLLLKTVSGLRRLPSLSMSKPLIGLMQM